MNAQIDILIRHRGNFRASLYHTQSMKRNNFLNEFLEEQYLHLPNHYSVKVRKAAKIRN